MAFDAFLQLDGIPGESGDTKHTDWIELKDFHFGEAQPITGGRSTGGAASGERVQPEPFVFIHVFDKSSPKLHVYCCNGSNIPKATLEVCRATGEKTCYYKVDMTDVAVGKVQSYGKPPEGSETGTTGESPLPSERVELYPTTVEWTYTVTDQSTGAAQGNVSGKWDYHGNEGG